MSTTKMTMRLLQAKQGEWKKTPVLREPSMPCWQFLDKMRTYVNEGDPEFARRLIAQMFEELFPNETRPDDKSWLQLGERVAYRLMHLDRILNNVDIHPEMLKKYQAAEEYNLKALPDLLNIDVWHLDDGASTGLRPVSSGPAPKGKKGDLKYKITATIEQLGKGEIELECGVGSKGHTIMRGKNNTVTVEAKKNGCTYDLSVEYDRNVLFNRLQRWARKEDIFA